LPRRSLAEFERIVGRIRSAWPDVKIILRGDSGFCRNELMSWCESHRVDFVIRQERLRHTPSGTVTNQFW